LVDTAGSVNLIIINKNELASPYLYPKAALNIITLVKTVFGVQEPPKYME
jgi:hypothetical protein